MLRSNPFIFSIHFVLVCNFLCVWVNSITIDTTIFVYLKNSCVDGNTIHPLIRTQQDAPHPPKDSLCMLQISPTSFFLV
jgi:hypothetical protein